MPNLHIAHFSEGGRRRISCSSSDFQSGILIAVVFSASQQKLIDANVLGTAMRGIMSRQEADTGSASSEYLTVPELAKWFGVTERRCMAGLRRAKSARRTVFSWSKGVFLIHWPTFRAKQFKPREKLRGQVPDFSEEPENGVARNGQTRPPENRL